MTSVLQTSSSSAILNKLFPLQLLVSTKNNLTLLRMSFFNWTLREWKMHYPLLQCSSCPTTSEWLRLPIILDAVENFVHFFLEHSHEGCPHPGPEDETAYLQRFLILEVRCTLHTINQCLDCTVFAARAFNQWWCRCRCTVFRVLYVFMKRLKSTFSDLRSYGKKTKKHSGLIVTYLATPAWISILVRSWLVTHHELQNWLNQEIAFAQQKLPELAAVQ